MTDDKSKPARLDNDFVSLEEPWQVHYWTTNLTCTPDELSRDDRRSRACRGEPTSLPHDNVRFNPLGRPTFQ